MARLGFAELVVILVIVLFVVPIKLIPLWQILKKAGLQPALAFISIIPLGGTILLYVIGFSEWPTMRERSGRT